MKCNQSRRGFELVPPCPFPTMITLTPRAPQSVLQVFMHAFVHSIAYVKDLRAHTHTHTHTHTHRSCVSKIWDNFQNIFFSLISPIFEKKNAINLNFHDLLYYSNTFSLKLNSVQVRQKRNDKESMIYLTSKASKNISEKLKFLHGPIKLKTKPLDYAKWGGLKKKNKFDFPLKYWFA